jgi:hypothetical protein
MTKDIGCPYCGGTDGCNWTLGFLGQHLELNKDDWKRIYWFMKYVEFPFLHRVILDARERNKKTTEAQYE